MDRSRETSKKTAEGNAGPSLGRDVSLEKSRGVKSREGLWSVLPEHKAGTDTRVST